MARDVTITYQPEDGDHLVDTKPGAPGGSGAHYWELREHLNNRGFIDWNYWFCLPTWTAIEAGCLADAVDPNKFEPDPSKDQAGRSGLTRNEDLADTVFVTSTEANHHVRNLIRLCERQKAAATPSEWARLLLAVFKETPVNNSFLSLPTKWPPAGLEEQETTYAESEQVSWECTDTQSKNAIKGGRHEKLIRDCHLVPAIEASEILAQIFPYKTSKSWSSLIHKEPKWLSKDINNQFGEKSWLVKANGGVGGSGHGSTCVYLPIILVRFIQHSKTAAEAQSRLDLIKRSNIEPLSEKLAFATIEQCASWTIKNHLPWLIQPQIQTSTKLQK